MEEPPASVLFGGRHEGGAWVQRLEGQSERDRRGLAVQQRIDRNILIALVIGWKVFDLDPLFRSRDASPYQHASVRTERKAGPDIRGDRDQLRSSDRRPAVSTEAVPVGPWADPPRCAWELLRGGRSASSAGRHRR